MVAKAGIQTIALQATTAGDVEMPFLSQQVLEEPQVHFVWLEMDPQTPHFETEEVQITTPSNSDNVPGQDQEMIPAPKVKPVRPVGAMLDSALARQARATRASCQVGFQKEIVQQKMEDAQRVVAAADQGVQDTSLFADGEVRVEALKIPPQPHGLDTRARGALTRMTEALNNMKVRQQQQQQPQQAQILGQSLTPTVTQGTKPLTELPVTQGLRFRVLSHYFHITFTLLSHYVYVIIYHYMYNNIYIDLDLDLDLFLFFA